MRDDNFIATAQYGDFTGTVSADETDQVYLGQLAEKFGVDLHKYYVIGINVYFGEFGDVNERLHVNFLAIDTMAIGAADNDSIQEYINSHKGILPYVKLPITKISFIEILDYFKRLDLVLTYKNIKADKYQLSE